MPHATQRGYSLVELAIVITIIGLVVGAVVAGKTMLRQSELQSLTLDYSRYVDAVTKFRQQYNGWPGDLLDATTFWNSGDASNSAVSAATCRTGIAPPNNMSATCNGDNNGQISAVHEPYLAWQHLMLARLVKGNFTGISTSNTDNISVIAPANNGNVPPSRLKQTGWSIGYKAATSSDSSYYDQDLSNYLAFGSATSTSITSGPALKPEEAAQLDKKLDDGTPYAGRVVTFKPAAQANCVNNQGNGTDTDDAYNVSYKEAACALMLSLTLK